MPTYKEKCAVKYALWREKFTLSNNKPKYTEDYYYMEDILFSAERGKISWDVAWKDYFKTLRFPK